MKYKLLLHTLELVAIGILAIVIIALYSDTYLLYNLDTGSVSVTGVLLLVVLTGTLITATIRWTGYTSYKWLWVLGICMIITGGYVFYYEPTFFVNILETSYPFWHKVTVYTLPAICIEGGFLTFMTILNEANNSLSKREKALLTIMFTIYALIMVATNFLTVGNIITVDTHILISRVAVISILIVFSSIGIITRRSNNKPF